MKIGIITTTFNNLGSRLQNIATVELLKEKYPGSKIETIVLHSNHGKIVRFLGKFYFFNLIFDKLKFRGKINKNNKLCHFKSYFIKDYSISSLKFLDKIYDLFVIGSDQIWNNLTDASNFYFGMFTDKKICNSPSFIPENCKDVEKLKNLLSSFKDLNVREEASCKFIQEKFGLSCKVLDDPTLRLKKETWDKIAKNKTNVQTNMPLVFVLNNKSVLNTIFEELKLNQEKVNLIFNKNTGRESYNLSPLEFISIIKQSSEVITNSFHGACFGYIFGKKLTIYKQNTISDIRYDFFKNKKCVIK